jgi:RNA polymerase sigma-70 factor (ECF subfamily)
MCGRAEATGGEMRDKGAPEVGPGRAVAPAAPVAYTGAALADQSDDALAVSACRDRDAFLILYRRYVDRVERYVLARISDPSDLEDVVSIIFMRSLSRIYQFRPERGSFAAWIFTIARNAVKDHYRARYRLARWLPGRDVELGPSAEEATLHQERLGILGRAVDHLTRDQRDALALRYAADLRFAEIGRTMGRSEDAAQKLVERALDSLRRELQMEEHA